MKRLKSILGSVVILIACSGASHAKVYSVSRANCFPPGGLDYGNESISWDPYFNKHWLRVRSDHYLRGRLRHSKQTGWEYTWNNNYTAHKDTVSQTLWTVQGLHEGWNSKKRESFVLANTSTNNCNF